MRQLIVDIVQVRSPWNGVRVGSACVAVCERSEGRALRRTGAEASIRK